MDFILLSQSPLHQLPLPTPPSSVAVARVDRVLVFWQGVSPSARTLAFDVGESRGQAGRTRATRFAKRSERVVAVSKMRSSHPAFSPPLSLPIYPSSPRYPAPSRCRPPACSAVATSTIPLGQTVTQISTIGAGTISWGDTSRGYNRTFSEADTVVATAALCAAGVTFFDTAEVYGSRSIASGAGAEQLLSSALAAAASVSSSPPIVATKYFPVPWTAVVGVGGGVRLGRGAVRDALRRSLTRLGAASVPLYYLHFPMPLVPGLVDAIADLVDDGLVNAVGVSNHNVAQLKDAGAALRARGVPLAANQFRYHLLDRSAEASGLLEETLAMGATPVGYEPYCRGLLTGRLTDGRVSPGRKYTAQQLKLYKQMCDLMRFVGATSGGGSDRAAAEVALAFCVAKGVVSLIDDHFPCFVTVRAFLLCICFVLTLRSLLCLY